MGINILEKLTAESKKNPELSKELDAVAEKIGTLAKAYLPNEDLSEIECNCFWDKIFSYAPQRDDSKEFISF
jgi:hypothetical protein